MLDRLLVEEGICKRINRCWHILLLSDLIYYCFSQVCGTTVTCMTYLWMRHETLTRHKFTELLGGLERLRRDELVRWNFGV